MGAGDDEVEARARLVARLRVEDVLALGIADARRRDRPHEGDAGKGEGGRGADHGDDVRIVLEIVAERGGDDLGLVAVGGVEERPDRPIDQARGQHLLLARPALALEEAARDLAGGEALLLIVDGEREEVDAGLGLLLADGGAEHHRLAIGDEHGAVGLAGKAPGLEDELAPAPHQFLAMDLEHS
jgi:hypothetical protein